MNPTPFPGLSVPVSLLRFTAVLSAVAQDSTSTLAGELFAEAGKPSLQWVGLERRTHGISAPLPHCTTEVGPAVRGMSYQG